MEKDLDLSLYDKLFKEQDTNYTGRWQRSENAYNCVLDTRKLNYLTSKKRSKIFIPVTRNTVNIIKSIFATAFFSNGNPIEILPVNDGEKDLVTDRNKVLNYYYSKYKPAKELIKAFHSSLLFDMGIAMTYWDKDKERVVTKQIPVSDVAFDHECMGIDDIEVLAYREYESVRATKGKIENGYYNVDGVDEKLFSFDQQHSYNRNKVKHIFKRRAKGGWKHKIFIKATLVREAVLENNPFQYGYALSKLPAIDENNRKDQILCYGDNIAEYLKEIQDEINYKRNVKNDIQEKILNPDVYVGDKAKVNPSDLVFGAGKRIKCGDVSDIRERAVPTEISINNDLQILAGDSQSAVGVNSIQEGQTSASDRRSANALAVVNSNSSMRIQEMIMLINDTLFEHWAKTWVKLVMKNASDEVINAVTGKEYPLGRIGERDDIEFDLKINFGMTLDKQQKINDKLQAFQITSQNPNVNPELIQRLLKDLLVLIDGEDTNYDDMFDVPAQVPQEMMEEEVASEPDPEELEKMALLNGGL
jgi:hypothetical protein